MGEQTHEDQIAAIEATAAEVGGDVRINYSGRGMYGATCYGIDCDDADACIEAAAARGLRSAVRDRMGKGYIVYWPHVTKD